MSAPLRAAGAESFARSVFSTSRAAEFLQPRALQSQTGQPVERFGDVVVKELFDNSLDAAEAAGVAPEITLTVADAGEHIAVTVADNGPGLPAEVVERMLDFNVLVSDKAAYRSPTRGAQGNAFKTLLGIPHALGVSAPVVIEACGTRHEITVSLDPGGNVEIRHDRTASTRTVGTAVTVPLPAGRAPSGAWLQKFASVNPHGTFNQPADSPDEQSASFYKSTAPDGWRKPLPTEPTSPWWYNETALKQLVFAHVGVVRRGGRDLPVGEFVRTFAGLTNTAKARAVLAAVPGIKTLSDFANEPDKVGTLLVAMKAEARRPKPASLGRAGEDHLRTHLDSAYGVERFWYRRKEVDVDGVGWGIEVALAETTREGSVTWAVNYSPTFGDPLASTHLSADEVSCRGGSAFLMRCDAYPDYENDYRRAAVVHIVTAAAEFTDKGKTALNVPPDVAAAAASALAAAGKELRTDKKRSERDARGEQRRQQQRKAAPTVTIKAAVFAVMAEAIDANRGPDDLPFPVRNLFYAVRDMVQQFGIMLDDKRHYAYFRDDLVQQYQAGHGRIIGMYYDPRGDLYEPHTDRRIPLGTQEIAAYHLPSHLFDKIMYVEKKGFRPMFEAAGLAERHDMAIAYGQGQPVEAIRALFERADPGAYKLFVLHDADHYGYSIAHTIAEATPRMPGYSVDVIDLGLSVAQSAEWGLRPEDYTRKNELHWWMPEQLDEQESEWFVGRSMTPWATKRKQWSCKRVELNALRYRLVEFVEAGLEAHGAGGKLVPPVDVIVGETDEAFAEQMADTVRALLDELIDVNSMVNALAEEVRAVADLAVERDTVSAALTNDPTQRWTTAVALAIRERIGHSGVDLRARLIELLAERSS